MIPQGSLKRIALELFNIPPNNHDLNPASALTPSSTRTDHLSLAIHAISQSEHLTHLELNGRIVISPSLFWPDIQIKPPCWPNLVSVQIAFSMTTADGGWYFTRDDNANDESDDHYTDSSSADGSEADDDTTTTIQDPDPNIPDTYNQKQVALAIGDEPDRFFRSKADPEKLDPLFEAAARAAAQMPRLRHMWLKTHFFSSKVFDFRMVYFAPGERMSQGPGSRNVDVPRLDWWVGPSGYEPVESTLKIWRRAKGEVVQTVTGAVGRIRDSPEFEYSCGCIWCYDHEF